MWNRLLVPLDGSDQAESILPHLRRLLRRSDSEVIVLRVVPPPPVEEQPFPGAPPMPLGKSETDPVRNVLVPMDLSEPSGSALGPTIDLAKVFEARLVFLQVLEPGNENGGTAEESALARLREFSARAAAEGVGATEFVDRGDVVPAILENARFH